MLYPGTGRRAFYVERDGRSRGIGDLRQEGGLCHGYEAAFGSRAHVAPGGGVARRVAGEPSGAADPPQSVSATKNLRRGRDSALVTEYQDARRAAAARGTASWREIPAHRWRAPTSSGPNRRITR